MNRGYRADGHTVFLIDDSVDRFVIELYHRNLTGEQRSLLARVEEDSRIRIPLDWISDPDSLVHLLRQNNSCWVFNGSAVWWHTEVAAVLNGTLDAGAVHRLRAQPVAQERVESWVQDADPYRIQPAESISIAGEINASGASVMAVGGDRQTWVQRPEDFRVQHVHAVALHATACTCGPFPSARS